MIDRICPRSNPFQYFAIRTMGWDSFLCFRCTFLRVEEQTDEFEKLKNDHRSSGKRVAQLISSIWKLSTPPLMSLLSPAPKHSVEGRLGAAYTPSHLHGSEAGTPSRVRVSSATTKPHSSIPVAPKWTLSRPYLTLGHLFEPRGSLDVEEAQSQPIGTFPVEVQEILVKK